MASPKPKVDKFLHLFTWDPFILNPRFDLGGCECGVADSKGGIECFKRVVGMVKKCDFDGHSKPPPVARHQALSAGCGPAFAVYAQVPVHVDK